MDLRRLDKMPAVGVAMTPFPHFVGSSDPVVEIERLMAEHGIRHVPVQEDGRVVGIVSERDLHQLVNRALPPADKARIRARDILVGDPYVVEITAPLGEVVAEMGRRRLGSAIVVRRGKLAGILSVTDVCRVLAEILEARFAKPGGDAA